MIKKQKGFTLVEAVIAIVLAAIVMVGAARLLYLGFKAYNLGQNVVDYDWQARIALERMTRDIRAIASSTGLTSAQSNSITFTDTSGYTITYSLSGNQLQRAATPPGGSQTTNYLADGISSLNFYYYNSNGVLLGFPVTLANVDYIVVTLVVTYSKPAYGSFTISAGVYPWNINS
jgi:prepilin-type N-terminal cleavage/methylation domain-containing protein